MDFTLTLHLRFATSQVPLILPVICRYFFPECSWITIDMRHGRGVGGRCCKRLLSGLRCGEADRSSDLPLLQASFRKDG